MRFLNKLCNDIFNQIIYIFAIDTNESRHYIEETDKTMSLARWKT